MVEDNGGSAHADAVPTIAALLKSHRDVTGASYGDMARRTGGKLGVSHLQKLAEQPIREFPKPRTVELLSELLELPITTVLLAFGTSLGLEVRQAGQQLEVMLPPGTDVLTVEDRDAIRAITRALIHARREAQGAPQPDLTKVEGLQLATPPELKPVEANDSNGP